MSGVAAGGATAKYKVSGAGTVKLVRASKTGSTVSVGTVTIAGRTYRVTEIAAGAFKGCSMKKVVIADSVVKVGKGAFANCKKLKSATVGAGLATAGAKVFKGSAKLKALTLKSAKLAKKSCKNLVAGSKIKTVKLKGAAKAAKAKKAYKKRFPKSVKVK